MADNLILLPCSQVTNMLHSTAPDFDQPLAVLKHCHDRIRKQLATLEKLPAHLEDRGADEEAQQAAQAVLRYFRQAAPLHHEDEEQDLLPMLQSCVAGADAALLQELLPRILKEHEEMDALWTQLESQLQVIANGEEAIVDELLQEQFCSAYASHMELEESQIATMAKRLFNDEQMARLGLAMQARRGIEPGSPRK
jgi:pyridoxamine 5'-phosphate oxidase